MSNVPPPEPDCRLPMDGPPRYRADQMHAHAAAVSAADNAALLAELDEWRFTNKVDELGRHVARQAERIKVLEDALRMWMALHDNPAGYAGKYGKALDAAIAAQQTKIDAAATAARAALEKP